ncbi:hypothetical protein V6N12_007365 [Hibiscus sabdariffa]|uniref:Endonuclease/exonuclease/phosphatase domain-containing protein n=1 Tax=Hibiscus sabdariffa TaxID=183260 RepID=A0ABR2F1L4_9ROSI
MILTWALMWVNWAWDLLMPWTWGQSLTTELVCLNVRGLEDPRTVRHLRHELRDSNSSVVFLIRTKLSDSRMARVHRYYGFPHGIDVSSVGRSIDLSLAWKDPDSISLCSFFERHIDFMIDEDSDGKVWKCTGFYGAREEQHREESWNFLRTLAATVQVSWLVVGDFNEIMFADEKREGLRRSERQMSCFRYALSDCSLMNIGYRGSWYTWEKGRVQATNIRERVDRGVANDLWWNTFQDFTMDHIAHSFLDHCPLLLNTVGVTDTQRQWHVKFEASWLLEDSCEHEVLTLWNAATGSVSSLLLYVCPGLNRWFCKIR